MRCYVKVRGGNCAERPQLWVVYTKKKEEGGYNRDWGKKTQDAEKNTSKNWGKSHRVEKGVPEAAVVPGRSENACSC